jgi:hypothetical protein
LIAISPENEPVVLVWTTVLVLSIKDQAFPSDGMTPAVLIEHAS